MKRSLDQAAIGNREEDMALQSNLKKKKIADDAQQFIFKVFHRFENDALTRHQFITLLSEYKSKSLPIFELLAHINQLFKGHPDLLIKFKHFLPESLGIKPAIGTHPKEENVHVQLLDVLEKRLSHKDFLQLLDVLKSFKLRNIGRQQLIELMEILMTKYKIGPDSYEYQHFFGWIINPMAMNTHEMLDNFQFEQECVKRSQTTILPEERVIYQPLTYPPTLVTENNRALNQSNHVFDYQYGVKSNGPSYVMQKFDDIKFTPHFCGGRTVVDQAVLNDEYICVGKDSPLYHHGSLSTYTIPELQRMEEEFLKEDHLSSLDTQIDMIKNTFTEFTSYHTALKNGHSPTLLVTTTAPVMSNKRKKRFEQEDDDLSDSYNFVLNREHLTTAHRLLLHRLYQHGYKKIIKWLRIAPMKALPVVLNRLKVVEEQLAEKRKSVVIHLQDVNYEGAEQLFSHNANRFRHLETMALDKSTIKSTLLRNFLTFDFVNRKIHRDIYSILYQSASEKNKRVIKSIWIDWIIPLFRLEPQKYIEEPTSFKHQQQIFGQLVTKEMIEFMYYYHILYRRLKRARRNFMRKLKGDQHRQKFNSKTSKGSITTIKTSNENQFFNVNLPNPYAPELSIHDWDKNMFNTRFIPLLIRHFQDRNIGLTKQKHFETFCIRCLGNTAYEFFTIRQVGASLMQAMTRVQQENQYQYLNYQYSVYNNPSVVHLQEPYIDQFMTNVEGKPVIIVMLQKSNQESISFHHIPYSGQQSNKRLARRELLVKRKEIVDEFVANPATVHQNRIGSGIPLFRRLSTKATPSSSPRLQSNGLEWQYSTHSNQFEVTAHTQDIFIR